MSEITADRPSTLASFWHDLPREGRLLLSVVVFEFLGTGLVLPFLVVYLHEVRGFALERRRSAARPPAADRSARRRARRHAHRPASAPAGS